MKQMIPAVALLAAFAAGCINVKTESEVKPIHITLDVNLKVDKELDKSFADETRPKPTGNFKAVREMMDRGAAGFTKDALLEAREGATDDDRILVAEENVRHQKRYEEIAKSSGVAVDAVRRRRAKQLRERIPAGTWYQEDDGTWKRK